jgi:oxygen-independent coproporphyrinogen-3 oxidase
MLVPHTDISSPLPALADAHSRRLGVYVHIPFCEKKCIYCDFYSLETTHHIAQFVDTLIAEIELRARLTPLPHTAHTLFFGGGTPSLLSSPQMERIFSALHTVINFSDTTEITMECNPGTITHESLSAYRSLGFNRLSFGVQSFFADDLHFLSRIHTPDQAEKAISIARSAGFDNVNLDLMFALPHQTFERWDKNLQTALSLGTDHISAYSLIFEEGTPLNAMKLKGKVRPADEDLDARLYAHTMAVLAENGYEQYEVSNFAKPGKECRHNMVYWEGEEYVSFGPSAHGYLHGERYGNVRSLKRYTDDVHRGILPAVKQETLGTQERMTERLFLELRSKGIRVHEFLRDFHCNPHTLLQPIIDKYADKLLFRFPENRIALTSAGYAVCDELTTEILVAVERG